MGRFTTHDIKIGDRVEVSLWGGGTDIVTVTAIDASEHDNGRGGVFDHNNSGWKYGEQIVRIVPPAGSSLLAVAESYKR